MENKTKIHFHCNLKSGEDNIKENCCVDLIFERYNLSKIELRLYTDNNAKTTSMLNKMLIEEDIANYIEVLSIDGRYQNIDFKGSKITTMLTKTDLNYISLGLSQVKYEWIRYEGDEKIDTTNHAFFLSKAARKLSPVISTKFDARGKWEDATKRNTVESDYYSFSFTNEFFQTSTIKEDNDVLSLSLTPILDLYVKGQVEDETIFQQANSICLLASFYLSDNIDFYKAIINKEQTQVILIKSIELEAKSQEKYSFTTDFRTFEAFFNSIQNLDQISLNYIWWKRNIEKIIISNNLDGESKFLILYNILEQTLSYLRKAGQISNTANSEYFKGISSNLKKIKSLCQELVAEIKSFIPIENENDREEYQKQNGKIEFYKNIITNKSSLRSSNKIQLILDKLDIDSKACGIDSVKELVSLRDDIIHSNREITFEELDVVNINLFKMSNLVLLKLLNPKNELSRFLKRK